MRLSIFLFFYFVIFTHLQAQISETNLPDNFYSEEINTNDITDEDLQITGESIDLNEANAFQIMNETGLSLSRCLRIVQHRIETGPIQSIYELQMLGFNEREIEKLKKYLLVSNGINYRGGKWKHQLLIRSSTEIERRKGFISKAYQGGPFKSNFRYAINNGKGIKLGLSGSSDPGEKLSLKDGFDNYGMYVSIERKSSVLRKLVIGNQSIRFSHGLILNTGRGIFKGSEIIQPLQALDQVNATLPTAVNNNLKGVSASLEYGRISAISFVSFKQLDGREIISGRNTDSIYIPVFTGLHRTTNEIEQQNSISEWCIGTQLKFHSRILETGVNLVYNRFGKSVKIRGSNKMNASLSMSIPYDVRFHNMQFSGEIHMAETPSMIHGLILPIDKKVDIGIQYRKYSKTLDAVYVNSFSGYSPFNDEEGLYAGFIYKHNKSDKLCAFVDFMKHSKSIYRDNGNGFSKEYFVQWDKSINKQFQIRIRYKNKLSTINNLQGVLIHQELNQTEKLQTSFNFILSKESSIHILTENRDLLCFSVMQHYKSIKVSFGYTIFNHVSTVIQETGINNQRNFVYLSGSGNHINIAASIKLFRKLDLGIRINRTVYSDRKVIGSGNNEINGNLLHHVSLRMQYNF